MAQVMAKLIVLAQVGLEPARKVNAIDGTSEGKRGKAGGKAELPTLLFAEKSHFTMRSGIFSTELKI